MRCGGAGGDSGGSRRGRLTLPGENHGRFRLPGLAPAAGGIAERSRQSGEPLQERARPPSAHGQHRRLWIPGQGTERGEGDLGLINLRVRLESLPVASAAAPQHGSAHHAWVGSVHLTLLLISPLHFSTAVTRMQQALRSCCAGGAALGSAKHMCTSLRVRCKSGVSGEQSAETAYSEMQTDNGVDCNKSSVSGPIA